MTPLMRAARGGHAGQTFFIFKKTKIQHYDFVSRFRVYFMRFCCMTDVCELLLKSGADFDAVDCDGWNAL